MGNDGKRLEQFVESMEKAFAGHDVAVERSVKIFNSDGVQEAEFDIVVSGRLGTVELRALIECRDRPSKGAADGQWIEGLASRRDLHGFSHVIAVSTTGFSPGAIRIAERFRIELRELQQLDSASVEKWFFPLQIEYRELRLDHLYVLLNIRRGTASPQQKAALRLTINSPQARNAKFFIPGQGKFTVFDLVRHCLTQLYGSIEHWNVTEPLEVLAEFPKEDFDVRVLTKAGLVFIESIRFTARYHWHEELLPVSASHYTKTSSSSPLSESVSFQAPLDQGVMEIGLHKLPQVDGSAKIVCTTRIVPVPTKKRKRK